MFKKTIAISLSVATLLCLAACGPKEEPAASIPPAEISDQAEEFSKPLVPLENREGKDVESPYYRISTVDGELCYEVQVEGEDEPTQVPIDSVIYIVGSPEECKLEKVSFSYAQEGGEAETVEQYRIYATSNAAATEKEMDPQSEENEATGESTSEKTEAPAGDEAHESSAEADAAVEDAASSKAGNSEHPQDETGHLLGYK